MYRHGGVLIAPVEDVPAEARELPGNILARVEATGHSHRVEPADATRMYADGAERFLKVTGPGVRVLHEEHGPIELPTGTYRVWQQREYEPDAIRTIRD